MAPYQAVVGNAVERDGLFNRYGRPWARTEVIMSPRGAPWSVQPNLPSVASLRAPSAEPTNHGLALSRAPRALARTSIDQSLCFYDQEMLEHIGWGARLLRYDPTDPLNIGADERGDPDVAPE